MLETLFFSAFFFVVIIFQRYKIKKQNNKIAKLEKQGKKEDSKLKTIEEKEHRLKSINEEITKREAHSKKLRDKHLEEKNSGVYKDQIEEQKKLTKRLRNSIIKIENDFARKIKSFADNSDEFGGLDAIKKQKKELAKKKVLPETRNPDEEEEDEDA